MTSVVAVILGVTIVLHEWLRPKQNPVFDFMRGVNLLYLLAFVLVPVTFTSGAYTSFSPGANSWLWMFVTPFNDRMFLVGELYAVLGYLALCAGYYIRPVLSTQVKSPSSSITAYFGTSEGVRSLSKIGLSFLLIGSASLFIYSNSLGGFVNMMVYSAALRINDPSSPVASNVPYLKNFVLIITVSSYLLYASLNAKQEYRPRWLNAAFILSFILSLVVLFHQAGRLNMLTYIITFPIAYMIKRGRVNIIMMVIGGFMFILFSYFGKEVFHIFQVQRVVENKVSQLEENNNLLTSLVYEFAFPWLNLGYSTEFFPHLIGGARYGYDIITSALMQLPDRMVAFAPNLPPTLSQLNTQLLGSRGGIPVDLVTYGIYTAGLPGLLIVCILFGRFGRMLQQTFVSSRGNLQAFGVALMLWFSYRIMYGDPNHAYTTGFALLITIPILYLSMLRGSRKGQG